MQYNFYTAGRRRGWGCSISATLESSKARAPWGRRRVWGSVAGVAVAALLVAAAVLWKSGFLGPRTAAAAPSRVVAIVEFKNLSQNAADAWLAPALTAMLGTELGASDQIRVVPLGTLIGADRSLEPVVNLPLSGGFWRDAVSEWHPWEKS